MKTPTSKDDARLMRLRSKAASRARKADDVAFREGERARVAAWRAGNREKCAPKNRRPAPPITIGPLSRSTARGRTTRATTSLGMACDTR